MSDASDPVAMRTSELRGARHVGSTTYQMPSMQASVTTWKSIGYRPGAYTDTTRAATLFARRSAAVRWAKSRHTPSRPSYVATGPSIGRDEPVT